VFFLKALGFWRSAVLRRPGLDVAEESRTGLRGNTANNENEM
jgi:hypothetical protein